MFFGFTHYFPGRPDKDNEAAYSGTPDLDETDAALEDRPPSQAQIYDLAHQRRLRALQSYIAEGHSLNEAARLIGVSQLTVLRWDDHGRR